jgi:hypothetical protein
VLEALADCRLLDTSLGARARGALLRSQNDGGGWAGQRLQASTAEETSGAIMALARFPRDQALAAGNIVMPVVLIAVQLIFVHDSSTNLVGAMRDVEGDRKAGCATAPVVYGQARAAASATALACCWMALGGALLLLLQPNPPALALVALAAALAVRVYAPLWIGQRQITRRQALGAHKNLVAERLALTTGFIAVYAPAAVALGLLVVTLTVSLCSQIALRDKYEHQAIAQPSVL